MEDARHEPDHVLRGTVLRLLLVDTDVDPVLEVLHPLCVHGDMTVVGIATTGQEAIRQAFTLMPDIVLIDPHLPDMVGIHVVEVMVSQALVWVVIMSANCEWADLTRAMIAGARGYLVKPFNIDEASRTLATCWGCAGVVTRHAGWGGAGQVPPRSSSERLGGTALRYGSEGPLRGMPRPYIDHAQAEANAREVLSALLTEVEYQQLSAQGYIEVQSRSRAERTYRIPASGGQVLMLESGKEVLRLCLQPTTMLPRGDVVLTHKLLLEADEEQYLRTANHFTPAGARVARRTRRAG